jgi:hypothetical protein
MAVVLHGYTRTTGDMDIWVRKSAENYQKILKAFYGFGMPVFDMLEEAFLSERFDVWSFGREPVKIDLMTEVKGLNFEEAFSAAIYHKEAGIDIRFLHINSLIQAKKASARYKDLDDIDQLTKK